MEGYIILCDHNTEWLEGFWSKVNKKGIDAVCVENLEESSSYFNSTGFKGVVVCSLVELDEYLKRFSLKDLLDKAELFVISDNRDDGAEIEALKMGCADFQYRGRNILVIVQRLIALLSKNEQHEKMVVDTKNMIVRYKEKNITLKKNEAELLKILCNSKDKYVSAEKICDRLWGNTGKEAKVSLISLIYRLRKKLPDKGNCLKSIYGKGYFLSKNDIQKNV